MPSPRLGRPLTLRMGIVPLALLLAGGAGLTVLTPSAPALPPASDWNGRVPVEAKPRPGQAQLTGVVNDEAGRAVDGIAVAAYAVVGGARAKVPAASDLTYEGPGHAHGFYRLRVPAGAYIVTYRSLAHAHPSFRPQIYRGKVRAPSQRVMTLRVVAMRLVKKSVSHLSFLVNSRAHSAHQRGRVTLRVRSRDVTSVLGRVRVVDMRRGVAPRTLESGRLVKSSHGRLGWWLPRLSIGRHVLVAEYLGAANLKATASRTVVVVRR